VDDMPRSQRLKRKDKDLWEDVIYRLTTSDKYMQSARDLSNTKSIKEILNKAPFKKIRRNCKLIYKKTIRIDIRDSLKMISMPLSDFSKAFKLDSHKEVIPYGVYTRAFIASGGQATNEQLMDSPFFE
jgi:hypothetical protein